MKVYVSAKRDSVFRSPGEDLIYIRCQMEGEYSFYEAGFSLDQNSSLSREVLEDTKIDEARKSIRNYRKQGEELVIDFNREPGFPYEDKMSILDFLREQ